MKNIITVLLFLFAFTTIHAQTESTPSRTIVEQPVENTSINKPKKNYLQPLISIQLPQKSNDPIHKAGNHLSKAGTLLTVASISATVGTVLLYIDSPVGLLFSITAIVCEFSAYSQFKRAGQELQSTESKK
ncbi:MAG: hypothetical protein EBR94_01870 [Bacteroidetes bacterium]|jgi:hypothetical protein|nr:hypothetical protein [Bacteroidota bacterium]